MKEPSASQGADTQALYSENRDTLQDNRERSSIERVSSCDSGSLATLINGRTPTKDDLHVSRQGSDLSNVSSLLSAPTLSAVLECPVSGEPEELH